MISTIVYQNELQSQSDIMKAQNSEAREQVENLKNHLQQVQKSSDENLRRITAIEKTLREKSDRWEKVQQIREKIYTSIDGSNSLKFNVIELTELSSSIVDSSRKYKVPISLILAVIHQESAFNKSAVSSVGAKGLMQIMDATADSLSKDLKKDSYNPQSVSDNVSLGTFYLCKLLKRFDGNVELAVKAYNVGPEYTARVESGEYDKYPEQTTDYSQRVLDYKSEYEQEGL